MMTKEQLFARALRRVIGGRLKQSKLGEVWHDDRTWLEIAKELVSAIKGDMSTFVLVEKSVYSKIVAEARQMQLVRKYVEDYQAMLPPARKQASEKNAYARWANEHMKNGK